MSSVAPPAGWDVGVVGIDCKLYYSTAFTAPTRIEITNAVDITENTVRNRAELKSRLTTWAFDRATTRRQELEFGYRYRRGTDAVFTALRQAFEAQTTLLFWILDGPANFIGTQGKVFPGQIFDFGNDEPLEDGKVFNVSVGLVEFRESTTLILPQWFTVA